MTEPSRFFLRDCGRAPCVEFEQGAAPKRNAGIVRALTSHTVMDSGTGNLNRACLLAARALPKNTVLPKNCKSCPKTPVLAQKVSERNLVPAILLNVLSVPSIFIMKQ